MRVYNKRAGHRRGGESTRVSMAFTGFVAQMTVNISGCKHPPTLWTQIRAKLQKDIRKEKGGPLGEVGLLENDDSYLLILTFPSKIWWMHFLTSLFLRHQGEDRNAIRLFFGNLIRWGRPTSKCESQNPQQVKVETYYHHRAIKYHE